MGRKFLDEIAVEYPEKWVGTDDDRRAAWQQESEAYLTDEEETLPADFAPSIWRR